MRQAKTYDNLLILKDAGLLAASAACQVAGADKILDLGTGLVEGDLVIDVSALEVASGDEVYHIGWQLSNSATFASGIFEAARFSMGDSVPLAGDTDSPLGRFVFPVSNDFGSTLYRYARLYVTIAGTIATGINFKAYLAKD